MRPRILVIDDESAIRDSLKMTLEYDGYDVERIRSGHVELGERRDIEQRNAFAGGQVLGAHGGRPVHLAHALGVPSRRP